MVSTFQKKSDADLRKVLKEKRAEVQRFRFSMSGSKTRNVKRGRDLRKEIAQILTEITKRSSKRVSG